MPLYLYFGAFARWRKKKSEKITALESTFNGRMISLTDGEEKFEAQTTALSLRLGILEERGRRENR